MNESAIFWGTVDADVPPQRMAGGPDLGFQPSVTGTTVQIDCRPDP